MEIVEKNEVDERIETMKLLRSEIDEWDCLEK